MEIYGSVKLRGTLDDGTGDELITRDTSTKSLGVAANALGTLTSAHLFVGDGSNLPQDVAITGDVTISNVGVTSIGSGVIVNADVSASAAIAFSKMAALTASRALASDANGLISVATTTLSELNFLSGATSSVQTQLNSKQATITGASSTTVSSNLSTNKAVISNGSGKLDVSAVTTTELSQLSGVSANLQTQLNARLAATITSVATGDILYYNGSAWVNLPRGTDGQTLRSSAATILWDTPTINGIPVGGTDGQALLKQSGTDFDADWETLNVASITDLTATASELNILDGAVISTAELNFLDNASANIQDQLNNKMSNALTTDSIFKGVGGVATASTDLPTGITIGGAAIYRAGGSDVSLADGGTGASLTDPNADRIMFWDDSAGAVTWLTVGSGLSITTTTISATGGVTNSAAANELMKSDGTNAVPSGLGSTTAGDINLGLAATGNTTRTIQAEGLATDIDAYIKPKGAGIVGIMGNDANSPQVTVQANNSVLIAGNLTTEARILRSAASSVEVAVKLSRHTTSTPSLGIGTALSFETETAVSNFEVGSIIESVTTDITSASEDFDLVFKTMAAGATAAEGLRVKSDKSTAFAGPATLKSYTVVGVPTASSYTGAMIYVSNEAGGAIPAFSDGTNWRRVTDRAIIS